QKPQRDVAVIAPEPIAHVNVELQNFVARNVRGVAYVALRRPIFFHATEETRGMIVERKDLSLMQRRFLAAVGDTGRWKKRLLGTWRKRGNEHRSRNVAENGFEIGKRNLVFRAERPLIPDQLIQRQQ